MAGDKAESSSASTDVQAIADVQAIITAFQVQMKAEREAMQEQMQAVMRQIAGKPKPHEVAAQLHEFEYDPASNLTIEPFIDRFNTIFASDQGKLVSEADKLSVLLGKLNKRDYKRLSDDINPTKPEALSFADAVKHLERLFGRKESVFSRRYKTLHISKRDDEDFGSYTARINKAAQDFDFASFKLDDFKNLLFVQGLKSPTDAAILKKALEKLTDHQDAIDAAENPDAVAAVPPLTIDKLRLFAERQLLVAKDREIVEEATPAVNPVSTSPKPPARACHFCGGMHWHRDCPFKALACNDCKQVGHKKGFCSSAKAFLERAAKKSKSTPSKVDWTAATKNARKYVHPIINGKQVSLKLDSGSDWTIIAEEDWKRLGNPKLTPPSTTAVCASGAPLKMAGSFLAEIRVKNSIGIGEVHVSKTGLRLFGNASMDELKLWDQPISSFCDSVTDDHVQLTEKVRTKFPSLFSASLGKCTATRASLDLKEGSKAPFIRARPVPFGARKAIEDELHRLEQQHIITRVTYAPAAAPIVAVKKKDGRIRITGDYSTGLNRALNDYHYPLPTPETIFASLAGMDTFSTLDLANAFLQVELTEDAKLHMAINTHLGLYQVNRMQPGVKTAPGQFQELMDKVLAGTGAMAYLDDVIVPGKGPEDHQQRLFLVLKKLEDAGLTLRLDKCMFGQPEIRFLGKIIDAKGQRADPEKLRVIRELPKPENISQLRSFLGAINWYGGFIPNLQNLRGPLDNMLRKGEKFVWTNERDKAFIQLKQALHANLALAHYDPSKPLVVAADASAYGIGATLLQRLDDGALRPILHAATSFNDAERNYPQVEREALALVYAVKKFRKYIYGRRFELHTDHKPLLAIFGSKNGIPIHTANCLRRYALTLLGYDFAIRYIDGANFAYADFVSRLISSHAKPGAEDIVIAEIRNDTSPDEETAIDTATSLPVLFSDLQKATAESAPFQKVIKLVQSSWPQTKKQVGDDTAAEFFVHRNSLQCIRDVLFYGDRPVIPPKMRKNILEDLHEGHPGASRMQGLARTQCFWPGITHDIDNFVKNCESCATNAKSPIKDQLHPWPIPDKPWQRLHIDFAGPMNNDFFLVVVDAFSNWPEVVKMRSTTAEKTTEALDEIFSHWGPCRTLVSDNGPQFCSSTFKKFCNLYGIQHITSAPYHPQSNGRAEKFVDTLKRGLRKMGTEGSVDQKLRTLLASYRRMPSDILDNKSPFELVTGRPMPSRLDLIKKPEPLQPTQPHTPNMAENFNRHHGAKDRQFQVGDPVHFQRHQGMAWIWQRGTVTKRLGAANYEVSDGTRTSKLHANQLKLRPQTAMAPALDDDDFNFSFSHPQVRPLAHEDNGRQSPPPERQGNERQNASIGQEDSDRESNGSADDSQRIEDDDEDDFESANDQSAQEFMPETPPQRPQRSTAGRLPARYKDFIVNAVFDDRPQRSSAGNPPRSFEDFIVEAVCKYIAAK